MAITKSLKKKSGFQITFKKVLSSQILSLVLILLGSIFVFLGSTSYLNLDLRHPFITKKEAKLVPQNKPVKLFIPSISKKLDISEGEVVNNRWTISQTGVSFLTDSALPGTTGNSVIYGHNRNNILGRLPYINNGDKIYVLLNNGEFVKYEVLEEKEISPYQVEILSPTSDSRLTIFTCSGFLDQARFVAIAKRVNTI